MNGPAGKVFACADSLLRSAMEGLATGDESLGSFQLLDPDPDHPYSNLDVTNMRMGRLQGRMELEATCR